MREHLCATPQRESNQLVIVGRSDAPLNTHMRKDAALKTKLDKLLAVTLSLVNEIKALNITPSKIDLRQGVSFYDEVRRFECDLIRQALLLTDGHQVRAARLLGIGVTTLNSIIKRYGISPQDPTREPQCETEEDCTSGDLDSSSHNSSPHENMLCDRASCERDTAER